MTDPERIGPAKAAEILGCSLRTLQIQSAKGKVPSAARMFGTKWSYDPVVLRRFVRQKETEACRAIYTGEVRSGGADFSAMGPSIDEAFGRLIGRKRASDSRRGARR